MPLLTHAESALQGIALSNVQAGEQLVDAVAKVGTQGAAADGTATDATTRTLLAIIDTAINTVNLSASIAGSPGNTSTETANWTNVLSIVVAVLIVIIAVITAALAFGAGTSLVALAAVAATAIIGDAFSASTGDDAFDGQLMGAMIGAALVMLVTGGGVSSGMNTWRAEALAKLIKVVTLIEGAASQYRPPRLSADESSETIDRIAALLRRLLLLLRRYPSAPRIQMILPRLETLAQALAAAAARLRTRIAIEAHPPTVFPPGGTVGGVSPTTTTTRLVR
jgi:hypothetical protein